MKALEHIGEAQAAMMPIIGRLQGVEPALQPQLWLWCRVEEPLEHTLDNISDLIASGYQQVHSTEACLETQLYDIKRTIKPGQGPITADQVVQRWYQPGDKPYVPVILTFSVPNGQHKEGVQIPLLNPLPLPQHGEYAMIEHEGYLKVYSINVLPLEARQRWAKMGEALRALASPGLWPKSDQRHFLASRPIEYQRVINQIAIRAKFTTGAEQAQTLTSYALLEAAKIHVDELRTALRKPNWLAQWQEIQRMAQELAGDYYEHHLQTVQAVNSSISTPAPQVEIASSETNDDVRTSAEEPVTPVKKKRTRRSSATAPVPLVSKGKDAITIKSDVLNHEIINSLRDKSTYTAYPEQGVAEHRHKFYQKDRGQILISIRPLEGESWETVLNALNTLGDGCIDTYIAVMAIAIDRNGTQHIRTPFQISPDDILTVCDKKKSHGSYTPLQRAEVIKHLKTLSQAHIVATMPGRPPKRRGRKVVDDGTTLRAEGALIDLLSFKIGEYHTITGEEVWEKRSIAVGEWATMIPELNTKTATMLRQVLAYSAKNERYQKRLGVYLTFMFRINARHAGKFPNDISMGALLEGAGIVAPRQQGEFREAIEHALERLQRDKVIGNYWRVVDDTPKGQQIQQDIHEHGRGWFHSYLQQKWNFEPPQQLLDQYRKLLKEAPEAKAGATESTANL